MRINGAEVRTMYESHGPIGFQNIMRRLLGLQDDRDRPYRDSEGMPMVNLESQRIRPNAFNTKTLAEKLIGDDAYYICGSPSAQQAMAMAAGASRQTPQQALESAAYTVPTQFANVNTYGSTVAGLLEARMLEVYQRPSFMWPMLCEQIPSDRRTEKLIGVSTPGDIAKERKPGNPHARAKLEERYSETPETVNQAAAIDITREAARFDQTRQLMGRADSVVESLALRKEYDVLRVMTGGKDVYSYGGTSYSTYLTAGNWINDVQKEFNNLTDFSEVTQLFTEMTDPESGEPIEVGGLQVFPSAARYVEVARILKAVETEKRTDSAVDLFRGSNPLMGMGYEIIGSPKYPYIKRVLTAPTAEYGLNLSSTNADKYTYIGNFKKAFAWIYNIPLTIERASANDYQMADHGLIASLFADEMGVAACIDPRYVARCKNE